MKPTHPSEPDRPPGSPAILRFSRGANDRAAATLSLGGDWPDEQSSPPLAPLVEGLKADPKLPGVTVDATGLGRWGTGLAATVLECRRLCELQGTSFDTSRLPRDLQRLLQLALPPPTQESEPETSESPHPVEQVGLKALELRHSVREAVTFLGECALSLARGLRGRAYSRKADFWLLIQQCGADALPIVSLIAFLVGLILAFVGAIQLERFGASIYVADLVAIAMTREMGCVMVAIVLCGRTGAAFAAHLGTMKVNQEIDAFQVFGISPIDFLVLPRLLALLVMIPLLTLYANLVGILGGFVVARIMLGLSVIEYWNATLSALTFAHLSSGVVKSLVFGLLIAFTGCLRGLHCGTNAAAVGAATTSAVVTAITGVVAADAVFAVIFNILEL